MTFNSSRRTLSNPLFPYTTLFQSVSHPGSDAEPAPDGYPYAVEPGAQVGRRAGHPHGHARSHRLLFRETDRKSTRLNSSHRCISYAVFCLKKKNLKYIVISMSTYY